MATLSPYSGQTESIPSIGTNSSLLAGPFARFASGSWLLAPGSWLLALALALALAPAYSSSRLSWLRLLRTPALIGTGSCALQPSALLALAPVYFSSRLLALAFSALSSQLLALGSWLSALACYYRRCFLRQFLSSLQWKALVPPKLLHIHRHGLPLLCTRVNSGSSDVAGGQHLYSWSCAARSAQAAAALRGVRSLDVGCRMTLWSDTFSVHSSAVNCGLMIWCTHYPWPPAVLFFDVVT